MSFLQMLAYLLRYIGKFSSRYEVLRKPTRDDAKFAWTNEQQTTFEDLKKAIISIPVLISNYPRHETLEICDCSPTEPRGALFQKTQHGYQQSSEVEKLFLFYTYLRAVPTQENNDRIGLFSILYFHLVFHPHRRTKKVENTSTLYLWITVSKWSRKLVPKAHARVQFFSDVFRCIPIPCLLS